MNNNTNSILKYRNRSYPRFIWISGIAAGIVNGLLGAGGGVIVVFALAAYSKEKGEESIRDSFATTVACVLPMSIISAASYASTLKADISGFSSFMLPAVAGGIIGAVLTDKINTKTLKMIFALLTIIAGINMILR